MKKFNVTYEQIASYSNIYAAYLDARKGKSERNEIMRFSLELDAHLNDLYNDLQEAGNIIIDGFPQFLFAFLQLPV